MTDAAIAYESDCIELICAEKVYIVKPKKLSFEFINDEAEWNYFLLETEKLKPITMEPDQQDNYAEKVYEISPAQYIAFEEFENMPKADVDTFKSRYVCRYLKGSFVFFHKDSVYKNLFQNTVESMIKCQVRYFTKQLWNMQKCIIKEK